MKCNSVFLHFLHSYDLPGDLSFSCRIPKEVQEIVDSDILQTNLGITLTKLNKLRVRKEDWENQSTIEYDENHFHVDQFVTTEMEAFKLGAKTLWLLARKFEQQHISGVRLLYSFQSRQLGQAEAIENNIHSDGDEYHISDRLSFHRVRQHEEVVADDFFDTPYYALLILDV